MRRFRIPLVLVAAVAIAATALILAVIGLYTDWLWFCEVGYRTVFSKSLFSRFFTGAAGGVFFGGFLLLNLLAANRLRPSLRAAGLPGTFEHVSLPSTRIRSAAFLLSAASAWFSGLAISSQWLVAQRFWHAAEFGVSDPIYAKDAGFYVFRLPFLTLAYEYIFGLLVLSLLACGALYLFSGGLANVGGKISFHPRARQHLFGLATLLLLVRALGYRLEIWRLVYSPRGVAFGASYADIHAELPALNVLTVLCVLTALLVLWASRRRDLKPAIVAVGALFLSSLVLRPAYVGIIQGASVGPDEIAKETPFIEHNVRMTRQAFGLDNIVERDYPASEDLTLEALGRNSATVDNIRLWDWRPLQQTYSQLQEIRLYYTFDDVDLDRYYIDGNYRQVTLSAREMNQDNLPATAQTWINRHLKFTHGYGLVVSPANNVSAQGLPLFYLQDIPPKGIKEFAMSRPEIYFGELTHDYVIVDTREKEFDYPLGDENAQTTYEGRAGVSVGSLFRRLAFALKFQDYEIVLASAITPKSRVLFNRDIKTRVSAIAPFLSYDGDAYPVIHEGRAVWMLDAYTTTKQYPYSEPSSRGFNYIRNSVKVTVDAYDGDVTFYLFDQTDPIVNTYARIFPGLFKPFEQMPDALKKHIRYPADLFDVQAEMYLTFHMQDPTVFYNKEDQWSLAQARQGQTVAGQATESFYTVMQLPGEQSPEFVMLLPFTPANRQNMIAWLAARSDEPNYGQMMLFKFPKERLVYGPSQVNARIDQDAEIAPQISLWSQSGSQVIRGNLLVIPIENSILYVEPLYLQSTGTKLPELKRILVSYGNQVVMEPTLEQALARIFGAVEPEEGDGLQDGEAGVAEDHLVLRAAALYRKAQQSLKDGDWAGYGEAMDELGSILTELENRSRSGPEVHDAVRQD